MKPYKISLPLQDFSLSVLFQHSCLRKKKEIFTWAECNMVFLKRFYNFFVQNVFSRYIIMEDLWIFVVPSFLILGFVVVNMMAARLNPPVNAQNNPVNAQNNPVNAQNKRPFRFYPRATLGRANRHSES